MQTMVPDDMTCWGLTISLHLSRQEALQGEGMITHLHRELLTCTDWPSQNTCFLPRWIQRIGRFYRVKISIDDPLDSVRGFRIKFSASVSGATVL